MRVRASVHVVATHTHFHKRESPLSVSHLLIPPHSLHLIPSHPIDPSTWLVPIHPSIHLSIYLGALRCNSSHTRPSSLTSLLAQNTATQPPAFWLAASVSSSLFVFVVSLTGTYGLLPHSPAGSVGRSVGQSLGVRRCHACFQVHTHQRCVVFVVLLLTVCLSDDDAVVSSSWCCLLVARLSVCLSVCLFWVFGHERRSAVFVKLLIDLSASQASRRTGEASTACLSA